MKLEETKKLIETKKNKGEVKAVTLIRNKKGFEIKCMIVEIDDCGFITVYDNLCGNIQINENIKSGDMVEVTILDGMIRWDLIKNKNKNYFVPYSVDISQIINPINNIPLIRIYNGTDKYEFTCFATAIDFYNKCKFTLNLQSPVVAFKGLEVDLWDIREDN